MPLRIFDESDAIEAVFALHGWLSAAEVNEVKRLAAESDRPLRLDLAHLVGVDAEGVRTLRALRQRGVRITGSSPYIELLMVRTGEADE